MRVVHCKDEDKELQTILKNNFNLLPGDQIDPDAACRWMLIKREMPVPDPCTGTDRWNIDFFFVDQNATPTFVECKRYLDTRARREVVGQVLEYAANAQYYWSADDIRSHAESTAKENNTTLDESFNVIQSEYATSTEDFFKEVERRLKASEIRIVFFLEDSPTELKRLVEFMNRQMGTVEVLLVEARQYLGGGVRILVPTLFGFTEQIREFKRAASIEQNRKPVARDWESFKYNAEQKGLQDQTILAMRTVYDVCKSLQADISWGRGVETGSFSPVWPRFHPHAAPFSLYANGRFELHFSSFQSNEVAKRFASLLAEKLRNGGIPLPLNCETTDPGLKAEVWFPHLDVLVATLEQVVSADSCVSTAPRAIDMSHECSTVGCP